MVGYILRRLLGMIPTLIIVTIITFIIIQLPPGDYFSTLQASVAQSGGGMDEATVNLMREQYALDRPPAEQYFRWVSGFPRGDFGYSFEWHGPVFPIVMERMWYTILVGGLSLVFMLVVAVPIGIYSATHQYTIADNALSLLGF